MAFAIKVARNWDGSWIASIPDLHPSCASTGTTLQAAVRNAQAGALSMVADHLRSNRKLPDEIKSWFSTTNETGTIMVGGCQHNEFPDVQLAPASSAVLPVKPKSRFKPALPKPGTLEHTTLVNSIINATTVPIPTEGV